MKLFLQYIAFMGVIFLMAYISGPIEKHPVKTDKEILIEKGFTNHQADSIIDKKNDDFDDALLIIGGAS